MRLREAEIKLQTLEGRSLKDIAEKFSLSIYSPKGAIRKGWIDDTVETYIAGSKQNKVDKDFEDTELRLIQLSINSKNKSLSVKSYLPVSVVTEEEVLKRTFMKSDLYKKINSMLIGFYIQDNKNKTAATFLGSKTFTLSGKLLKIIKDDYNLLRKFVKNEGLKKVSSSSNNPCKFFTMKSKDLKGKPRRVFSINSKDVFDHILSFSNFEYKKVQKIALELH